MYIFFFSHTFKQFFLNIVISMVLSAKLYFIIIFQSNMFLLVLYVYIVSYYSIWLYCIVLFFSFVIPSVILWGNICLFCNSLFKINKSVFNLNKLYFLYTLYNMYNLGLAQGWEERDTHPGSHALRDSVLWVP